MELEVSGSVVRFVHSRYEVGATERGLSQVFPTARNIAFDPMPLRAIFLAMARNGRTRLQSTEACEFQGTVTK
jgi:hypothetical protein